MPPVRRPLAVVSLLFTSFALTPMVRAHDLGPAMMAVSGAFSVAPTHRDKPGAEATTGVRAHGKKPGATTATDRPALGKKPSAATATDRPALGEKSSPAADRTSSSGAAPAAATAARASTAGAEPDAVPATGEHAPTEMSLDAPTDAQATAREIARRVRHFHAFRAEAAHATWRTEPSARWNVRSTERCLASLAKLGVPAIPLTRALTTPVPTPVVITGPVAGVAFRPAQRDRAIELSCELAARLPALARLLRAHGVRAVQVNSSYRDQPRVSFHTFGLGLDISAFETALGSLVVARDYELAPDQPTCAASPSSAPGRALQELACAIAASGLFSTVITPNYNAGHRDHFHFDIRPNDPKLFVR